MIGEQFLWVEKYRPNTVDDCILPDRIKSKFKGFVEQGNIPNLVLSGGAGVGKTTVARAVISEIGADVLFINGSNDRNIDTLRNEITQFASSVSMFGGRKYVLIDEADNLNIQSTQPALRAFIERYSKNCGFILTCNFPYKLMPPLMSRNPPIDFKIMKEEKPKLAAQMMARIQMILDAEGVPYEKKALAEVIMKYVPDWRRCINELQNYAANGKIDSGILRDLTGEAFDELIGLMKAKKFTEVRRWLGEHTDFETAQLYRMLYDKASKLIEPSSIPAMVMILGEYQSHAAFVADQEINNAACFARIMAECIFK